MAGAVVWDWDEPSKLQLKRLETQADAELANMQYNLVHELADNAVTFIKPLMRGNGDWQPSTGKLANSLRYEVKVDGDTMQVDFFADARSGSAYYQTYVDVGNFSPSQKMYAMEKGMKWFPISARAGQAYFFPAAIRGMGAQSPDFPRRFSDKAVDHLKAGTQGWAEKHWQNFFRAVVIT